MRIVGNRSGSVPSPTFEYFTVGATAVVAGQGLTLASGLLVTAKDATSLKYIAVTAGAISATNIPCEAATADAILAVPYTTGTPVVGTQYDLTTDGTGLLVADTTNPKVEVDRIDTTNKICYCHNISGQIQ